MRESTAINGARLKAIRKGIRRPSAIIGVAPVMRTPETPAQKRIMSWIEQDVDVISDTRLLRLHSALAKPPVYLYVIIFGFLVTMACFGTYRPQPPLVVLVSLYTSFIGLVMYLILALSDPFQGAFGVDPATLERLLDKLGSDNG